MKKVLYLLLTTTLVFTGSVVHAQGLLGKIEKAVRSVENANRNIKKNDERRTELENKTNPKSTQKSEFHKNRVGKILFAKGSTNPLLEDESQFVNVVDLSSPSYFNVYLEDPMWTIHTRHHKISEYDFVNPAYIRKYYINNQLIASYTDKMEEADFREKHIISDVLVPSNQSDFDNNEMRVGVLAHVFSSLSPGTHKLKVEYVLVKSTEVPDNSGSAAITYANEEYTIASGEVDVKIDAASLLAYCKKYGRPKFSKGVLEGQASLEKQIESLIKQYAKRTPIYIYASDNWELNRGALDRVLSREVNVYYVFRNDNGRCELASYIVKQNFDGRNYQEPRLHTNNRIPFKYVVCQNY